MNNEQDYLEEAKQLFAQEGLAFPYIPSPMSNNLEKLSEWVYGTRTDTPNPYDLFWFVTEVATQPVEDYLLFGHAGHGINSYAMHYYLVRRSLAVFLQISWGGAYTDKEQATQELASYFAQTEDIIRAVEKQGQQKRFQPNERLIVVVSDFSGSRWMRIEDILDRDSFMRSDAWQESDSQEILPTVLAVVRDEEEKMG